MAFDFAKQSPNKDDSHTFSVNLGDNNLVFKAKSRMTFFSPI